MNNPVEIGEDIIKIIERTREDILTKKSAISQGIIGLHYIAQILDRKEDIEWAKNELNGSSVEDIPEYREDIYCILSANHLSEDGEKVDGKKFDSNLGRDVSSIEYFLETDKNTFNLSPAEETLETINERYDTSLSQDDVDIKFPRAVMLNLLGRINLELSRRLVEIEKMARTLPRKDKNPSKTDYDPKNIFIVHGRDEESKSQLYDILKNRFNLTPIILTNSTNEGKTVIEKFESHSLNVGFAFVLLTPDDVGALKKDYEQSKDCLEDRSRENVILELGYFVGKLGRDRVCCIQKGSKELLPSDLHGLVTVRFEDTLDSCYMKIEDELTKANYIKSRKPN